MSKILKKEQIKNILYGATFLAAGGGGSLQEGLDLLSEFDNESFVELVEPKEMEKNLYAGSVGGIGAPRAMSKTKFGEEAILAFDSFKKVCALLKKDIGNVMGGELGGFNTMVPIYVAWKKEVPFVDGDGNGRAVPELSTGLQPINNVYPYPLTLSGGNRDVSIILIGNKENHFAAENLSRHLSMAYSMSAGFCTWPATGQDIIEKLAPNTISECELLGKAIVNAKNNNLDLENEINKIRKCKLLCKGLIKKIDTTTKEGFDFGKTIIQGTEDFSNNFYTIYYKNENLIIKNDKNKVLLTVPDMICMINSETKLPVTNADITQNMELEIYSTFAHPNWFISGEGFNNWKNILKKIGYTGERVCFK